MYKLSLTATGRFKLGALSKLVSRLVVKHKGQGGWAGNFIFKVIPTGSYPPQMATGGLVDPVGASTDLGDIHYTNVRTGADIAKGTAINNATTEDIWQIIADGCDVWVEYTHTTAPVDLYINLLAG